MPELTVLTEMAETWSRELWDDSASLYSPVLIPGMTVIPNPDNKQTCH